ncbi:vWA domain-containing protein [Marisediminicola sp. LYQ134]|uniref:vWA domain-containing protein n=1 Tax=Marisediminicola sp. LYQ134 TaxID=3391061 RepID=UPI0039836720
MTIDPLVPLGVLLVVSLALLVLAGRGLLTATRRSVRVSWWARIGMILLLAVIALRPAIPGTTSAPAASGGLEVYFVVDTTSSMAAEDLGVDIDGRPATRLDLVKSDIDDITTALAGAQFAIVTSDSTALQRVPLTSDVSAVRSATSVLTQEITYYSSGSSISEPVQTVVELLADATEEQPERDRVLFYFGDGEQTVDREPESFAPVQPFISGGGVLAYGSEDGGRMRVFDGYSADDDESAPDYIVDPTTGADAVSRVDTATLETIASDLGVSLTRRDVESSATSVVEGIDVSDLNVSPGAVTAPREFYWILAVPLGALALREALVAWFALRRSAPLSAAGAASRPSSSAGPSGGRRGPGEGRRR